MTTSEFITAEQQWERVLKRGQRFAAEIAELYAQHQQTECSLEMIELENQARAECQCVQVKSCWRTIDERNEPWEGEVYRLQIDLGGPAMQVTGQLDRFNEPASAVVEVQDWFKPWTDITTTTPEEDAALLWLASLFYYGAEE